MQVVFDAELLVAATAFAGVTWLDWPAVPPVTGNPEQDALGVIASSALYDNDWSLVVCDALLRQVAVALQDDIGLSDRDVADYLRALATLVGASGGVRAPDPVEQPSKSGSLTDVPLGLALQSPRPLVAGHGPTAAVEPLWGPTPQPILDPSAFVAKVDAARRAA